MTRTIVITGAASGIGKATAEILERAGDRVIRVDLQEGDVAADLGTPEGVAVAVDEITELSGGVIDGLVANAGVSHPLNCPSRSITSVPLRSSGDYVRYWQSPMHRGSR